MKQIYIIGYYNHHNLGDEQYKLTFNYIINNYLNLRDFKINFLDCDIIHSYNFNNDDIIFLGGGDILNEYFLDKIILKFNNKNNKIIAISVGLPYLDIIINTNKLFIIDYIFVRTKQDIDILKQYYHINRIFYIPDISYYLLNNKVVSIPTSKYDLLKIKLSNVKNQKIIALCLSRHIYHSNFVKEYNNIIQSFISIIKYLISQKYHIVLLPFNTNLLNTNENDILIHNDIVNSFKLDSEHIIHITNIDFTIEPHNILELYQYFNLIIPMRFHATLFSIYSSIPILPIFTTRKIENLLLDINYNYFIKLNTNDKDIPISLDISLFNNQLDNIIQNYNIIKENFNEFNRNIVKEFNVLHTLQDLILHDYSKISNCNNSVDIKIKNAYDKALDFANQNNFSHFLNINNEDLQKKCIQIISYILTDGFLDSIYSYGLKEKLFSKNNMIYFNYQMIYNEWKWVINDNIKNLKKPPNNPYGLFNINYIDQHDYSNVHRSGWQFVYENLLYLHNNSSNLLLDLYIDRTFHWNYDINKILGIIPYKKSWIGFIHHTFNTSFTDYNCYNLINNPDFIQSLSVCKGLFVLSNYLSEKISFELSKKNISIPIYVLIHPTEVSVPKWSYNNFILNKDKKIINIGGWYRDIYSFYQLSLPNKYSFINKTNCFQKKIYSDNIRKVCLKGLHMNNYYPSNIFLNNIYQFLLSQENHCNPNESPNISNNTNISSNISSNISCNYIHNNWYKHFYNYVKKINNSIDIIEYVDNDHYDSLLINNIVYLNLEDASAVNTVIECIVRNTPLIVNKHPAIVELLGEKYPLYYTNKSHNYYEINKEIESLLTFQNGIHIINAYKYLQKLNKNPFTINFFITQFTDIIKKL